MPPLPFPPPPHPFPSLPTLSCPPLPFPCTPHSFPSLPTLSPPLITRSLPSLPSPALPFPSLEVGFSFPLPFLSPSLSSPPLRFLRSRPPSIQLGGLGERCKLPQRVRQSPADKRFWVHFQLKTALLVIASLKSIFLKQNAN